MMESIGIVFIMPIDIDINEFAMMIILQCRFGVITTFGLDSGVIG